MTYILILCALAVGHSLFLAITLLILNGKLSNRLLALLLVLLAIRTGKSVVQMFLQPGMSYTTSVIGVAAMAAIGPVLYLLIRSLFQSDFKVRKNHCAHFIPAVMLPLTLLSGWKLLSPVYYGITAHVVAYVTLSWMLVYRQREIYKSDDLKWSWALILLSATTLLTLTFVLQISIYQPVIYATNVIVAALIFYGLSLWAIRRSKLFMSEPSGKTENLQALEDLGKRIQVLLEEEQIFTDSGLTVSLLSQKLKAPPYLVSKAINYYFKKSFSEILIQYRIKKAEQLLTSPESKVYTNEAIAFESGFNTLSAFYSAFKKIHKTTPAQFRQARKDV